MDYHEPVLLNEVLENLKIEQGKKYIDCTLGDGGHTIEILKKGGDVLGIELDPKMAEISRKRLSNEAISPSRWKVVNDNFVNIDKIAEKENWKQGMSQQTLFYDKALQL